MNIPYKLKALTARGGKGGFIKEGDTFTFLKASICPEDGQVEITWANDRPEEDRDLIIYIEKLPSLLYCGDGFAAI